MGGAPLQLSGYSLLDVRDSSRVAAGDDGVFSCVSDEDPRGTDDVIVPSIVLKHLSSERLIDRANERSITKRRSIDVVSATSSRFISR